MSIKFERNAYLESIKSEETFSHEEKILDFAKKNPQFSYGHVTFQKFSTNYTSKNWFSRKVIALPAFLLIGTIATVIYVTRIIFIGLFKILYDKGQYIKVRSFEFARDLEVSFGWLITFFNDKYGQYHTQQGKFHISCYHSFSVNVTAAKRMMRYFLEKDLDKEFIEISKIWNTDTRDKGFAKLAKAYLDNGNKSKALRTIKRVSYNNQTKNTFLEKLAASYLYDDNDCEMALKTIQEITDEKTKEPFILEIANKYLFDKTAYRYNDYWEKALKTIQTLSLSSKIRSAFTVQIADHLYKKNLLKDALSVILKLPRNSSERDPFIIKIARAYFKDGDRINARSTINNIDDINLHNDLFNEMGEPSRAKPQSKPSGSRPTSNPSSGPSSSSSSFFNGFFSPFDFNANFFNSNGFHTSNSWQPPPNFTNFSTGGYFQPSPPPTPKPSPSFTTHCKTLGLDPNNIFFDKDREAAKTNVTKAYRKLALTAHPDRLPRNSGESDKDYSARKDKSGAAFQNIANAYSCLLEELNK